MALIMESFVFPSDQDRADSPELDRVCDHLEAVLERLGSASESDDAAAKLAGAVTSAAVKAGGVEPGMELSGPQLLLAVNDMADALIEKQSQPSAAVAAINYALQPDSDGLEFLRVWFHGDFGAIRKEWPDAPETVFIGADPLHPATLAELEARNAEA